MDQMLDVHVARQPIFDKKLNVFAYELLFRSNLLNAYDGKDGDQATSELINNSFLLIGIEKLTNGRLAFINFTSNSLLAHIPGMLPKELVAVEVLEDVEPDEDIVAVCSELKKTGYMIVLDDFALKPGYGKLIELADIIKVDFRVSQHEERKKIVEQLKHYPLKFLAEKVETYDEFKDALQMGYSYFQGYFFCKPVIMSGRKIAGCNSTYFSILQEINRPEIELPQIEAIIKRDVALSYKLLKLINSPIFGLRNKVSSVRHALALLGKNELVRWLSLIAFKDIAADKPGELVFKSLIRARFAEKLAVAINMPEVYISNAFFMGMFSHIDALLDRTMKDILAEIYLAEEVKQALLDSGQHPLSILYKLIQHYETGDWSKCESYARTIDMDMRWILQAYRDALLWARELLLIC